MGGEMKPWRYEICYGPDAEANYAFVYDDAGRLVSNLKMHHAKSVVDAMNRRSPELVEALAIIDAFVVQEVDYMTRNNLGDPESQHNVKWARALLSRIREGGE